MTYSIFKNDTALVNNHLESLKTVSVTDQMLIPTTSYWSLQKSITNLQGLTGFYFPLVGLSEADFSQFMPLLIFVEATIYQFDEEYERHVDDPDFISPHMLTLRDVLFQLNLFDEKIETELFTNGLTYYRLEQQFCSGGSPTVEDIDKASLFKCFDFAILQRILLKLTNQPYDEEFLQTCRLSDQICKICCDLRDYKEDINRNVINTYRMFVRLYGAEAPQHLRWYLESLNSKLQERLKLLEKTRPEIAKIFIELWMEDLKFEKMWNAETESFAVPEIPEPILEEGTTISQ
ncbi:hypothetical protein QUA35_01130 [Microcoleus sp. N9_B2]|uniref:hypothetical protein n=1 Tax=unclassified Microcoleus TaxID=2642155 RepID=UPI002FD4C34C